MYKMFMTAESSDFVTRALVDLVTEVGAKEGDGSFWVCYGSFVLNQQTPESDLDLLYIHSQTAPVRRIQSSFEGHPVTVYSLKRNDFARDGEQRMFGGYFGGKVLNPCVVLQATEEDKELVLRTAGEFIAPFASAMALRQNRKKTTRANLVADSVLARFHLCPWYRSYFLRYYIDPDFSKLWNRMEEVVSSAFMKAGVVVQDGGSLEYCRTPSDAELHTEIIKAVARFWALGSCLHGSLPDFPDYYMQKSEQFIAQRGLHDRCDEMLKFLEQKANGR